MNTAASTGLGEAGRRQLLAMLDRIAAVADRLRPVARGLTLVATLSALWLAHLLQQWTGLSWTIAGIALFILALPALICGWLWWLLADVCELPGIAERTLGILRPATVAATPDNTGIGETFRLGGSLKQAANLAWEFDNLRGVMVGVLVLANPLFLVVLGVAMVLAVLLALLSALVGLGVLLF